MTPKDSGAGLLCIGASTGGPRALQAVITELPEDLPMPVIIVQHLPEAFTHTLASRLDRLTKLNVRVAAEREALRSGTVYIAPGGKDMRVKTDRTGLRVSLDETRGVQGAKPSFDVLLQSLNGLPYRTVIVVLTGMGSDGSKGIIQLRETGSTYVIAESEETAVIYGMPKSAIATGCVDEILPLHDIASAIVRQIRV
ncbi:CheB methylesterase domain-containing protein [Camelliibacillus cellulosilyticus]|uniref:protein-glutamate methylesterase n=1 Tax=Camelliibacillus cellulosilyticus TaxID=2174486 RepID=A0ABV9GGU8_9BACL